MESYDEAETFELVGCYLLSQLKQIPGIEIGLLQRWRACYTKSNTKGDRESKKNKYAKYLQKTI